MLTLSKALGAAVATRIFHKPSYRDCSWPAPGRRLRGRLELRERKGGSEES